MIPLRYCHTAAPELQFLDAPTQEAVKRFYRHLQVGHRSASTQRMYVRCVVRWLVFGGHAGDIDSELLARFLATRRRKCAVATVNMDIKALRAFYRVQQSWDALAPGHAGKLPRLRKPPGRLPRYLTDEQVGEVLAVCPDTFIGRRDRAIVMTLYATGLRASELIGMHVSHFMDGDLLYVEGKGGKPRYVPVGGTLGRVLAAYLLDRRAAHPRKGGAMWVRDNGVPLRNGRSAWEIVSKRIWQALGIRAGMHRIQRGGGRPWTGHFPHELRASCATALLHRGMPLPAIAELLGHDSLDSTVRYTGVDVEYLRGAIAHHPRALRTTPGASGNLASSDMKRLKVSRSKSLDDATPTAFRRRR